MEDYEKKKNQRKVGIYFIIFSVFVILILSYLLLESYIFRQNAVFVKGKVTGYLENKRNNKPSTFTPIIEYTAEDNLIKIQGNTYGDTSLYQIGEEASVCYNPKNIKEGRLDSFREAYQFQLLLLGGIFFFLTIGIYLYNKYKDYK